MSNRRRLTCFLVPLKLFQLLNDNNSTKNIWPEIKKKARGTPWVFSNFLARNSCFYLYCLPTGSDWKELKMVRTDVCCQFVDFKRTGRGGTLRPGGWKGRSGITYNALLCKGKPHIRDHIWQSSVRAKIINILTNEVRVDFLNNYKKWKKNTEKWRMRQLKGF